ncbi:MAG: PD40 domain-containing protein, partial [Bacteroidetes bacterium]|nr:PD40 domain-containing protein [Bacteroidota bacterium]
MPAIKLFSTASVFFFVLSIQNCLNAQGTRLLRQPSLSNKQIAFEYGADIWITDKNGGEARRITSTQAVEADPHLSPDGLFIAFTSNRSGEANVYVVPVEGGAPLRLTWYPSPSYARGWTPDGKNILYASTRETAPTDYSRLWTVPAKGGPSQLLSSPFGFDGSFA